MNSLSWLLYFAEVSSNISVTFFTYNIAALIAGVILTAITLFNDEEDMTSGWIDQSKKIRNFILVSFVITLSWMLFPTQNTIYLIIASESAEMVATDATTREMLGDIQNIVSLKLQDIADDLTNPPANNNGN